MTVTTLTDIHLDINSSDIDKDQICDTYEQTLVYSFNDVFQQSSIKKNEVGKRRSSIHHKAELARRAILEKATKNKRKSTASERVEQPKDKRSKKGSTINNGNENKRKAPTPERVVEPKDKRSKKGSTSNNGNEDLQGEIAVNEYPQKPKKQTSLSSFFFKTKQVEVYDQSVFAE